MLWNTPRLRAYMFPLNSDSRLSLRQQLAYRFRLVHAANRRNFARRVRVSISLGLVLKHTDQEHPYFFYPSYNTNLINGKIFEIYERDKILNALLKCKSVGRRIEELKQPMREHSKSAFLDFCCCEIKFVKLS